MGGPSGEGWDRGPSSRVRLRVPESRHGVDGVSVVPPALRRRRVLLGMAPLRYVHVVDAPGEVVHAYRREPTPRAPVSGTPCRLNPSLRPPPLSLGLSRVCVRPSTDRPHDP